MELLLLLLSAHFIGDFYAQPNRWVECRNNKHIKSVSLFKHVAVHGILSAIVCGVMGLTAINSAIVITTVTVSHLLIDLWKSFQPHHLIYFLIDQLLHVLVIIIVWITVSSITVEQITQYLSTLLSTKHLLIAISYLLVCKPASIIISLALKKHTENLNQSTQNAGLVSAGAWIGYLERCLTVSFIFMGQFAGIGFLVATKTIFRFGDLTKNKDMKLTEYMMLGTLLSYAMALFVGWNALMIHQLS